MIDADHNTPSEPRRRWALIACPDETLRAAAAEYVSKLDAAIAVRNTEALSTIDLTADAPEVAVVHTLKTTNAPFLDSLDATEYFGHTPVIVLCPVETARFWQRKVFEGAVADYFVACPLQNLPYLEVILWRALNARRTTGRGRSGQNGSPSEQRSPHSTATKFAHKRALVIEDDTYSAELVRDILDAEGFTVKTARTVLSACNKFRDQRFDVILADLMMPGLSGPRVVRALKNQLAAGNTPVIVTSAHSDRELVKQCIDEGARDYIVKPIVRDKLLPRVAAALGTLRN